MQLIQGALFAGLVTAAAAAVPVQAATFTTLLQGLNHRTGNVPDGRPVLDAAGNAYIALYYGPGYINQGSIVKVTPQGVATTIYIFASFSADGSGPTGGMRFGPDGALYGTTNTGGPEGGGTVFRLTPPRLGQSEWGYKILYVFKGLLGGPFLGELAVDSAGNLYGSSFTGAGARDGFIYRLSPSPVPNRQYDFRVLHSFTGADGRLPSSLILDPQGVLYGVTTDTGLTTSGRVFSLSPPALGQTGWTFRTLLQFTGPNGAAPSGSLLFGLGNTLIGTAELGGKLGLGLVYQLRFAGGAWHEAVLHQFSGKDGADPTGGLVEHNGTLYGATQAGGASYDPSQFHFGYGTVYSLSFNGLGWTDTVLHSFAPTQGIPFSSLAFDAAFSLYGITQQGAGFARGGTLYRVTP